MKNRTPFADVRHLAIASRWIIAFAIIVGAVHCSWAQDSTTLDASFARVVEYGDDDTVANQAKLLEIDRLILQAIEAKEIPGCVIEIARQDDLVYRCAYGRRQIEPSAEAMTLDTIFDLASLTKPVATATCVMKLCDEGVVQIDLPVSKYLPEFVGHGKDPITLEHLLTHTSGLTPDNALADYEQGNEIAWQRICDLNLLSPPGHTFRYSDVGFIVLGRLVERMSGQTLGEYAKRTIFEPLGMRHTRFNPPSDWNAHTATTQQRQSRWMRGEVHDPRAWKLGGVAGHAGLFSTLGDLSIYARMMLGRGTLGETNVLSRSAVDQFIRPIEIPKGVRSLGWDMRTGYSTQRGVHMSDEAFGHGGFTGTVLWIDPARSVYFVLLSNRVHPDGSGSVNRLAGQIATLAFESLGAR